MKIGLCMTTHNHLNTLRPCLESVTSQTQIPHLWHMTDDGSSDGTSDYLDNYAHMDGRFVTKPKKSGMVGAHANIADGYDWLFGEGCDCVLLIGDDIVMEPDAVERMAHNLLGLNHAYALGRIRGKKEGVIDGFSMLARGHWAVCRDSVIRPYFRHSVLKWRAQMYGRAAVYDIFADELRPRGTEYSAEVWTWRGRTDSFVGRSRTFAKFRRMVILRRWGVSAAHEYMLGYDGWDVRPDGLDDMRAFVRRHEFRRGLPFISKRL